MAYVGIALQRDTIDIRVKLHGPKNKFDVDMIVVAHEVDDVIGNELPIPKADLLNVCEEISQTIIDKYGDGVNILWAETEIGNTVTGICVGASATTEKVLVS